MNPKNICEGTPRSSRCALCRASKHLTLLQLLYSVSHLASYLCKSNPRSLNTTQVLSSLNSAALTLARNDVFSLSDDTTLALRVCKSCSISSILDRCMSNKCSYISQSASLCSSNLSSIVSPCLLRGGKRSVGTYDRIIGVDVADGSEVVGDLHLLRDGPTDADGVEYDDTMCLLRGNGPDDGREVLKYDVDNDTWRDLLRDGPECSTDGVANEEECDGYGMDSSTALH
ncbi:hypothetical protein Tco_1305416 [Tanacetum coccineum]